MRFTDCYNYLSFEREFLVCRVDGTFGLAQGSLVGHGLGMVELNTRLQERRTRHGFGSACVGQANGPWRETRQYKRRLPWLS
jgi:hypothetical protein